MSPISDATAASVNPLNPPPQIVLSLVTVPLLTGMLAGKVLIDFIQEMGQMSEEIFRGDRLPVIDTFNAASQQERP